MKNAFKAMVAMVSLTLATAAWGASEVVDGVTWYYETYQVCVSRTYSTYARIISGADKYTGDLTVPTTLGGYAVKEIGSSAFSGCTALKSVVIQKGVTSIGGSAFSSCSSLSSVSIPEGVTSIGGYAFSSCSSLTSVTIPEGVTSIGNYAFYKCSSLTSVTIPEGVKRIYDYAFYGCSSLASVTIPESVTNIGGSAFSGCSSLTSVTIPEGVASIGGYAFYNCSSLTRFDVPASVASLGSYVVHGCSSLKTLAVASGNTNYKSVNNCIVSASGSTLIAVPFGCEKVIIPSGVAAIPDEMFYGDSSLTSVTIPEGVTSIGERAFYNCSSLTSVTIPESVTSIGGSAFWCCSSLTSVTIPEGVTSIGDGAFCNCSSLTSVTIPEGVKSIGSSAFYYCSSLTSVTIPEGVTSIGVSAFEYCYSLTSVKFFGAPPSGVVNSRLLYYGKASYPREYGGEWQKYIGISSFHGYLQPNRPTVTIVSADIRKNDATIMDVVYKVTSTRSKVKVRALAFQDGERSFAKVVRVTDLIEGTQANVGDAIAANVEHKLSWRVSTDWKIDLAKVKFEVLAVEDQLLPLELSTIPATSTHKKMQISWNVITEAQVFDALLWLYADGDEGLTLTSGVLKNGSTILAQDATLYRTSRYDNWDGSWYTKYFYNAPSYVFSKMGFSQLSGTELEYAKKRTRLALSPDGVRQYAYRLID